MTEMRNGPYLVTKRTPIYTNPWMKVHRDDVVAPDGTEKYFGIIDFGDGASVLPIFDDGRVLLAREFRYAAERFTIEVFSGSAEPGEAPLATAQRELAEESGMAAAEWIPMGFLEPYTTIARSRAHLFVARGLSRLTDPPKGDDDVEVVESTIDEAYAMVRRGEIFHSQSCHLIALAYIDTRLTK